MPCGLFKPVRLLTPAILTTTPWFLLVSHFADEKPKTHRSGASGPWLPSLAGAEAGSEPDGLAPGLALDRKSVV